MLRQYLAFGGSACRERCVSQHFGACSELIEASRSSVFLMEGYFLENGGRETAHVSPNRGVAVAVDGPLLMLHSACLHLIQWTFVTGE